MPAQRKPRADEDRRLSTIEAAAWTGWNPETGKGGYAPATFRAWRLRGGGPPYEQPEGPRGKAFYWTSDLEKWWSGRNNNNGKGTR
jgi:hypothetical protein